MADAEYAARVKVRTEETKAISDVTAMLTSDEANDSFTKSMSFIQARSVVRSRAANVLKQAGKKFKSPKLVTLAETMRLDAFGKVKENIDSMVGALTQEQKDEVRDRRSEEHTSELQSP